MKRVLKRILIIGLTIAVFLYLSLWVLEFFPIKSIFLIIPIMLILAVFSGLIVVLLMGIALFIYSLIPQKAKANSSNILDDDFTKNDL